MAKLASKSITYNPKQSADRITAKREKELYKVDPIISS